MTPLQAIEVAKKYYKQVELRRNANADGNKASAKYHEGCMMMAMQIFEEFSHTHGFATTSQALECEDAILRTIRMVPTQDDIPQYYNCPECQRRTVVCRPKIIDMKPMVQTCCTACGHLIKLGDM